MKISKLKAKVKSGGKVNPKLLKIGLAVRIIRGSAKGDIGRVISWYDPEDEDPNYQINVNVQNTMHYLGLGDIRFCKN